MALPMVSRALFSTSEEAAETKTLLKNTSPLLSGLPLLFGISVGLQPTNTVNRFDGL
jgi:hypothetical protein